MDQPSVIAQVQNLPPLAIALTAPAYASLGLLVGAVYFRALWWNAQSFSTIGHLRISLALLAARFAGLGLVLFLAARQGALALLMTALGIVAARAFAVKRWGSTA